MAGDQLLDEIWYDTDSVFYMVVAMLTFTSIIGTLLYYKDQLIARPQNEEEEEGEIKETLEVTPQWRDPVLQVSRPSPLTPSFSLWGKKLQFSPQVSGNVAQKRPILLNILGSFQR